jgi:hypothetical protein
LPVAICSAAGVPGELVRRQPSECVACCRGTTRRFAALHSTPARPRAAIAAAITLQEKRGGLIELSVDQRRSLTKMGDKSEAFRRQTLIVLAQNRQIISPELDLAEAERDLHKLDFLLPQLASLRQHVVRADDTCWPGSKRKPMPSLRPAAP